MEFRWCLAVESLLLSLLLWNAAGQSVVVSNNPAIVGRESVTINCTTVVITGITLRFNGDPVDPSANSRVNVTSQTATSTIYTFADVTKSDNGLNISCTIVAGNEITLGHTILDVQFPPSYIGVIANQSVYVGAPFSFTLNLEASPLVNDNFNWTRNGIVLYNSIINGILTADSISIPLTRLSDAGTYSVVASNVLGSAIATFDLSVLCVPQLQPGSDNSTVKYLSVGQNFTIDCNITEGCPFSTEITLTVTGPGHFLNGITLNLTSDRSIHFTNIMSGDYTCKASNNFGESTFVYTVLPTSIPSSSTSVSPEPTMIPSVSFPIGAIVGIVVGVVLAYVASMVVLICCSIFVRYQAKNIYSIDITELN